MPMQRNKLGFYSNLNYGIFRLVCTWLCKLNVLTVLFCFFISAFKEKPKKNHISHNTIHKTLLATLTELLCCSRKLKSFYMDQTLAIYYLRALYNY